MSVLTAILDDLIRAVAWREGIVSRVYSEFGPEADASNDARQRFHDIVRGAIDELHLEQGPSADAGAAKAIGILPEVILGCEPFDNPPSTIVAFAVWRRADLWVFLAGRFCRKLQLSHFRIVLGPTTQIGPVAQAMIA